MLLPDETLTSEWPVCSLAYIAAFAYLLAVMAPGSFTSLATTRLGLTNKRVIGKRGLIFRKLLSLSHKDIDIVNVKQGILGTLFDYGTVIVRAKDGTKVSFSGISMPLDFQQQVNEAAEMATLGRVLSKIGIEKW